MQLIQLKYPTRCATCGEQIRKHEHAFIGDKRAWEVKRRVDCKYCGMRKGRITELRQYGRV